MDPVIQIYSVDVEGVVIHNLLAIQDGVIVGSVEMMLDQDGDVAARCLHVVPRWRNRGIGRLLMEAVAREAVACDARAVYLSCKPDNHAALHLYVEMGFYRYHSEEAERRGSLALSLTVNLWERNREAVEAHRQAYEARRQEEEANVTPMPWVQAGRT